MFYGIAFAWYEGVNIGLYQGAAALKGLESWQQTVAQNLSASQVPGYRKVEHAMEAEKPVYVGMETGQVRNTSRTAFHPKGINSINETPGTLVSTDNPMNVAISGEGFLKFRDEEGRFIYSRNGSLHLDANARLVNAEGQVLTDGAKEVVVQPELGSLVFREDGTIEQGGKKIGNLAVVRFENPAGLERVGGGFIESANVDPLEVRMEDAKIKQGFLEQSNISPIQEMVNLISISRAYEANQKVISAIDTRTEQSIRAFTTTS